MSIKINKKNYEYYKEVFRIICFHLSKGNPLLLQHDINPITILDNWQKSSHSLAIKGLQVGLNDSLSGLKYCPRPLMTEINIDLEQHNLPNVKQLLNAVEKTFAKVLKEKKIKNDEQYYIIKEILDDTTTDLTNEDKQTLSVCLGMYEDAQGLQKNI